MCMASHEFESSMTTLGYKGVIATELKNIFLKMTIRVRPLHVSSTCSSLDGWCACSQAGRLCVNGEGA